jgi:hypothetical protein
MYTFLKIALLDVVIIILSFVLFSAVISGQRRHMIWEKYISSFAKFVIYIFIATVAINVVIVYAVRYEKYLNVIAPTVQSVLVGFIASCVPRRGAGDRNEKIK